MQINTIFIVRPRSGTVFDLQLLDQQPGFICFSASGKNVDRVFKNESGGHRWQRTPPTEKRGRVQTSTITVVVLNAEVSNKGVQINGNDLEWSTRRGSGPGGQHRNKTDSCVDLVHKPTGIKISIDGRSQAYNKQVALEVLKSRLLEKEEASNHNKRNAERKGQAGCGMRGDKRRTIRTQDDRVTDHTINRSTSYKRYSRGNFDDLLDP